MDYLGVLAHNHPSLDIPSVQTPHLTCLALEGLLCGDVPLVRTPLPLPLGIYCN